MDVLVHNAAEQSAAFQKVNELHIFREEEHEKPLRTRKLNIKFNLSNHYNHHILPQYKSTLRKGILENLCIRELHNYDNQYLQEIVHSKIKEISNCSNVNIFSSEEHLFRQLGAYYKETTPHKLILLFGAPDFPLPSNFLCSTQLNELKEYLTQPQRFSALILDPLFFIYRSNTPLQKIEALRKRCFGSGITFILDERKTAARIHLKGLNFIFQFKADAILYGANLTNGIPFAAIAGTRQIPVNSAYPEAYAPSALALITCEKIISEFQTLGEAFHYQLNQKANRFVQIFNDYRPRKKSKIVMMNIGSIIWVKTLTDKVVHSKLQSKGIHTSGQRFIFLPTNLNIKDFSDLAHRFAMALKNRPRKYRTGKQNYSNKEQS